MGSTGLGCSKMTTNVQTFSGTPIYNLSLCVNSLKFFRYNLVVYQLWIWFRVFCGFAAVSIFIFSSAKWEFFIFFFLVPNAMNLYDFIFVHLPQLMYLQELLPLATPLCRIKWREEPSHILTGKGNSYLLHFVFSTGNLLLYFNS
jgi:hypothetical protein